MMKLLVIIIGMVMAAGLVMAIRPTESDAIASNGLTLFLSGFAFFAVVRTIVWARS